MTYEAEVLADSPWAYWKCDETSGSLADSSGNGRTATVTGTPTYNAASIVPTAAGGALSFSGASGQYAERTGFPFSGTGTPFTIEFWVRPTTLRAANSVDGLVTVATAVSSDGAVYLRSGDTGLLQGQLNGKVTGMATMSPTSPRLANGTTTHIVLTYDGTTEKLYVNGNLIASGTGTASSSSSPWFRFPWNFQDGRQLNGKFQHVSIYTSALSLTRIQTHYAAGAGITPLSTGTTSDERVLAGSMDLPTYLDTEVSAEQELGATVLTALQDLTSWTGDDNLRLDHGFDLHADMELIPTEEAPPAGTHIADFDKVHVTLPAPTLVDGVPVNWTPTVTRGKWGRYHIVIGGHDVTFYRGKRTRVLSWASNEPFGDADASLYFPQITEYDDLDSVPWWFAGARVNIHRRHPDGSKTWVWTGLVASTEPGRTMHCLGTLYQLDLAIQPRRFIDEPADIGHRIARAINRRGLRYGFKGARCTPVDTGIDERTPAVGDRLLTSYIQNILSISQTASGDQWTLALVHPRQPVIRLKDTTTEDWTVDCGAPGVVENLSRDYTQGVNAEYGTGQDGDCVWENRKFPNLRPDDAPLYPLTLPATFAPGGGTAGFIEFSDELRDNGYPLDSADTYLAADQDEVEDFQEAAGITVDGIVGPQTWAAAFEVGSNQGDVDNVYVKPLAVDTTVEPFVYNAQGARVGDNPNYDSSVLRVEKMTVFGDRISKKLGRKAAKQMLARDKQPGWLGTLTLTTDPAEGSRRDIRAGQNIVLRRHHGSSRLLHIARAEWDEQQGSMTLTVDTKARDLMNLATVHQRNRDVANPAGQPKPGWRTGMQVSDRVPWACEDGSGKIPFHAQYAHLWTVLRIPAGHDGVIAKVALAAGSGLTRSILRDLLSDPLPDGYHGYQIPGASKLAVAVFGKEVTANMLENTVGNPLNESNTWEDNADQLKDWACMYAAGGPGQAGGFYPHLDPGDGTTDNLTGRFVDSAGFPYESHRIPWLWLALYTTETCYVGGRLDPGAPA